MYKENIYARGATGICGDCKNPIVNNGYYWNHVKGKMKHIIQPIPDKNIMTYMKTREINMKNMDQYEDRIKQIKEKQKIYNREEIVSHFTDLIVDRILCAYEYRHDSFEYPLHISLEKYNLINDYEKQADLWKDIKTRVISIIINLNMKNKIIYNDSSQPAFILYFTSSKTVQFGLQTNLGVKWNYEL